MTPHLDVVILTDPRFMGGTSTSVETDVRAMVDASLKVGLRFVTSNGFFTSELSHNPIIEALLDLDGVTDMNAAEEIRADVAFFHHPMIFSQPVANPCAVIAGKSVIVAHQTPFRGDTSLQFDPFEIQRSLRAQFGIAPLWAPVSNLCRQQLRSFAPLVRLTTQNWPNAFHMNEWQPRRAKLMTENLVVGRHGRPNIEKWGNSGAEIAACLPTNRKTTIRTMGAERPFFDELGVDTSKWDVLKFNGEPVPDFLDSLDVFSYFHASYFVESFGRTVAEAMLMGARCILKPSLEVHFGPHAIYCEPHQVGNALEEIRNNLEGNRMAAEAARNFCLESFSADRIAGRLEHLARDPGTLTRKGGTAFSVPNAARKLIGLHRRRSPQLPHG